MATIKERILETLGRDPYLDDDELADRLEVRPRQTINRAARELAAAGKLFRRQKRGKQIINELSVS